MPFDQESGQHRVSVAGRCASRRENPVDRLVPCSQVLGVMNRIMSEHFGMEMEGCRSCEVCPGHSSDTGSENSENALPQGATINERSLS